MTRQLLVAIAISATMLGFIVLFFESSEDCSAKGGAIVPAFPLGLVCVARL